MSDQRQQDLTRAYDRMLAHIREAWDSNPGKESLQHFIDSAREKAVAVGEITREEADKLAAFIRRDLEDAARFLDKEETREFVDWLRFDIALIEDRLLELFTSVADRTKLAYIRLQEQASHANDYHSGEVTSIGTLYCQDCGQALHFKKTSHIPPCPKCHGSRFRRR